MAIPHPAPPPYHLGSLYGDRKVRQSAISRCDPTRRRRRDELTSPGFQRCPRHRPWYPPACWAREMRRVPERTYRKFPCNVQPHPMRSPLPLLPLIYEYHKSHSFHICHAMSRNSTPPTPLQGRFTLIRGRTKKKKPQANTQVVHSFHQGPRRREGREHLPRAGRQDRRREVRGSHRRAESFGVQRRRRLCP